jgi:hypothetical protein
MEKAELIAIVTDDGKVSNSIEQAALKQLPFQGFPVSIRPGRPVYRHVFQRLVQGNTTHRLFYAD